MSLICSPPSILLMPTFSLSSQSFPPSSPTTASPL
ncbi:unnamed protein product [Prunus brigantina]